MVVFERVFGPEHYEVAVNLNNLAAISYRRGDLVAAEDMYRRALAIKEHVLGPSHPELAPTLNNLGLVRKERGDYDDAMSLFTRAITTLDQLVAADHPTLTTCRENQVDLRDRTRHATDPLPAAVPDDGPHARRRRPGPPRTQGRTAAGAPG